MLCALPLQTLMAIPGQSKEQVKNAATHRIPPHPVQEEKKKNTKGLGNLKAHLWNLQGDTPYGLTVWGLEL